MVAAGMTGESGGQLQTEVDYCICVPSTDTPRIQEAHILVGHVLSELVEQALFGGSHG
jgi:D-sedoheptulose 7-phosphate isomerase